MIRARGRPWQGARVASLRGAVVVAMAGCASGGLAEKHTDLGHDAESVADAGVDTELVEDTETDTGLIETVLLDDPCFAGGPVEVQVGVGDSEFIGVIDGDDLFFSVIPGGPIMFYASLAFRVKNAPQFLSVFHTLTDVGTGLVVRERRLNLALAPLPSGSEWACVGEYRGLVGVIDWESVRAAAGLPAESRFAEVMCGTELRLDYRLVVSDVTIGTATRTMIAQPDPRLGARCDSPVR